MAELFRISKVWVVEFRYEGRQRIWYRALPRGCHVEAEMTALLRDLYGPRACLQGVRLATEREESDFFRGDFPKNQFCPTGRAPQTRQPRE